MERIRTKLNKLNRARISSLCQGSPYYIRVYLSSPIGKGEGNWYKIIKKRLEEETVLTIKGKTKGFKLINPKEWWDEDPNQLVEMDKFAIRNCDIVAAYIPTLSAGASMEIQYAHQKGKIVLAAVEEKLVSPWHLAHVSKLIKYKKNVFMPYNGAKKLAEEIYETARIYDM